ncbi:MAG: hypothetical protein PHH58_05310 [Rhodoferax sp.]|nr:hypothetical protein [Rhodoferax sp.]
MNYKESAITGQQWQRCNAVNISNAYKGVPHISFGEETVADVGGETYVKYAQGMSFAFDPSEVIELINPNNGEALGSSMTGAEIYTALYSLYVKRAVERDAAQAALPELPPSPQP